MIGMLLVVVTLLPEADLDLYLSKPPAPVECAADMLDYPPLALPYNDKQTFFYDDGDDIKPLEMQPGYLVSECELLRLTNMKIELKRMKLDLQAIRQLRSREFELWRMAEKQYQSQIDRLASGWWARNKFYIGMAVGAATMAATVWTAAQLAR